MDIRKDIKIDWKNFNAEEYAKYISKCIISYSTNILPMLGQLGKKEELNDF